MESCFRKSRKPSGEYRLVQDLRAVNQTVKDIYPVVANPYTLLTALKEMFSFAYLWRRKAENRLPLSGEIHEQDKKCNWHGQDYPKDLKKARPFLEISWRRNLKYGNRMIHGQSLDTFAVCGQHTDCYGRKIHLHKGNNRTYKFSWTKWVQSIQK